MIIAIPHIPARADFNKLAKAIETHGNNENHILLVTSLPSDTDAAEAQKFFDRVKPFFKKAFLVFTASIDPNVGFNLANTHFSVASRWAAAYQADPGEITNPPFLYHDPAYFPNESGWADATQSAFFKSGGKCFGKTKSLGNQTLPNGMIIEGGKRFEGPTVFDQKFATASSLINYLRPDELWRDTLRWEMAASSTDSNFFDDLVTFNMGAKEAVKTQKTTTSKKLSLDDDDVEEQKLVTPRVSEIPSSNGVRRINLD